MFSTPFYLLTKFKKMLYKYDKKSLQYIKARSNSYIYIICLILLSGYFISVRDVHIEETEAMIVLMERDRFSEEKLVSSINNMNFRFPHIVYAQCLLETGNFSSPIFIENNNLFGMREAKLRLTLSKGTKRNHAYYNNWKDSLYDYGLYYSTYLYKITSEEDYFNYLQQYYAENPEYVSKLKVLIKQKDLINKFK